LPIKVIIYCCGSIADDQSSKLSTGATSLLCSNKQSHVNRIISDDADINKISPNLPSSAAHKKIGAASDNNEDVNLAFNECRRISIRQSELVYRFKEIVVRKCPGYVQLSLVTHTTARNALNPKVFIIVLNRDKSFLTLFFFKDLLCLYFIICI